MDDPKKLKARLEYLEEVNRSRIIALDMIRGLGGLHDGNNLLEDPGVILDTCNRQFRKLVRIKTLAFYLVDEKSSDFSLYACYPESDRAMMESEQDSFIEDGTFSRAVLEKNPVTAASRDFSSHFLFHVLATASRVSGMCVAVLGGRDRQVPEAAFEMLSVLMTHCANALESYALYTEVKSANEILREKVNQLSRSQAYLMNEVAAHKKTLGALGDSEAQYRLLAETARELILRVSGRGKILYVNSYGLALGDYSVDELVDMDVHGFLDGIDGLDLYFPPGVSKVQRAALIVKGGSRIPLEISIVSIVGTTPDQPKNQGVLITGRDISEHLRAEAEKQSLEERLWHARKMESIGLLAGGTAHDFNNLLGIIFNYTDLSLECLPEDHPVVSYLSHVETASNQARDLARQLYTIGREDRHDTGLMDVNLLMEKTLKLLKSSLGKKLTLEFEPGPESLMVRAEETRLRQVFMNLITNAAHAMDTGRIRVGGERMTIEPGPVQTGLNVRPGPFIRIWVKDTGPGIAPETLPHIFEPYFSTKKESGNAGLGLAVVHGIITNYGGTVEVESRPSQGSCFYIYLPEAAG